MVQVVSSLAQLTTGYTVFEKDQVLTHEQLNTVVNYLDDQDRLTRVALLGVGLACGLEPATTADRVTIGKGAGVTTDGDLFVFAEARSFRHARKYGEKAPEYAPFMDGQAHLPMFELLAEATEETFPLTAFTQNAGGALEEMVAVLFAESTITDHDLCIGTDCDNLGRGYSSHLRVLLVDQAVAKRLQENLLTLDAASRSLQPVAVDRVLVAGTATVGDVSKVYRSAATGAVKKLAAAFGPFHRSSAPFLRDLFPTDPAPAWSKVLGDRLNAGDAGIQYLYDHVKDVAETWNELLARMVGEQAVCCPDVDAFPKHLVLGGLGSTAAPDLRTGFYPSPATGGHDDAWQHVRLLATKLDTLIRTFAVPAGPIRVTPSLFEDRSLEERAIPFYYQVTQQRPVHRSWSYALERRGLSARNYSYNGDKYGADGPAASPLTAQIGGLPFFRVEGAQGRKVDQATAELKAIIAANNLPLAVQAVHLGADKARVTKRPPRYTDLHRFHYALRNDVAQQLDEASEFGMHMKQQVDTAVTAKKIPDEADAEPGISLMQITTQRSNTVKARAGAAKQKLQQSYAMFAADTTWKTDVNDAVTASAEFQQNLGKVIKTNYVTPLDSLIGINNLRLVGWLDDIIKGKEEKEDEKLLFSNFLKEHPGLEHFAGVLRGGTYVMAYDANQNVVADFMLPYRVTEDVDEPPSEPPLTAPPVKPPFLVADVLQIQPPLERIIAVSLADFETKLEPKWKGAVNQQKEYLDFVKESVAAISTGVSKDIRTRPGGTVDFDRDKINDKVLRYQAGEVMSYARQIEDLRELMRTGDLAPDDRAKVEERLTTMQQQLGKTVEETADYMVTKQLEAGPGTDAVYALDALAAGLGTLSSADVRKSVGTGLRKVAGRASGPLQDGLRNVMRGHGLG